METAEAAIDKRRARSLRDRLRPLFDLFAASDLAIALLAIGLSIYYIGTRGIFQGKASGDGYLGFLYLQGIFINHSLDLGVASPEWGHILGKEITGHVANPCPIGPILIESPTYLLGLLFKKGILLLNALHPFPRWLAKQLPLRAPGDHGPFDYFMAGFGAFLAGLVGVSRMFVLLRRRLGAWASRYAVLAAVLGTPLTWYFVTQPLYQHACAFFVVTLFVERWDAYRDRLDWRRALILGLLAGLAMLMRLQEAIILILPGLDILFSLIAARRNAREVLRHIGHGLLILAVTFVVFLPQILLWKYYFGQLRAPQAPGHMRWNSPAIIETLFSTRAGLFPWIPLLYLAVPGLVFGKRILKGLAGPLGVLFLIDFYVNACAWDYHGSWAFGPRRFTDMTVAIAAGLGAAFVFIADSAGRFYRLRRTLLIILTALLIAWNSLLMECVRQRKTKSSCAGAYPASTWVEWAKGPQWLENLFARIGYPFVQPTAFLYGLIYHMPSTAFEGIVGNYILERDWRVRSFVLTPKVLFREQQSYVIEGIPRVKWGEKGTGQVSGSKVRLILPFSAIEPVQFDLSGDFKGHEADIVVHWNGVLVKSLAAAGRLRISVPKQLVHHRGRLNELVFTQVPPGSAFNELQFYSSTVWWR